MTAATGVAATRLQLAKIAIHFDDAGVPKADRARRLAMCSLFVERQLTSSAELTKGEAHRLIDWLESDPLAVDKLSARLGDAVQSPPVPEEEPVDEAAEGPVLEAGSPSVEDGWTPIGRGVGCWPDGLHWVPPGEGTRYCQCRAVTQVPRRGYCAPNRCYCGGCESYVAPHPDEYAGRVRAAKAGLINAERAALERRTRAGGRY